MLVRVERIPAGLAPQAAEQGRVILAHGELTGHHHSVDAVCAQLLGSGPDRFLEVHADTELLHQEHAGIPVEAGLYRVVQQREYAPEGIRNVAD